MSTGLDVCVRVGHYLVYAIDIYWYQSLRLEGSSRLDKIGFCDGNELCSQSFRNLFVYTRYYF